MLLNIQKTIQEKPRAEGDTIIEVLLSVTILGLVLALSFTSAGRSLNAGTDAANRNQALAYAQEQVELLRAAANNDTINSYPTDGTPFCINPIDGTKVAVGSDNQCHLPGQDSFGIMVKYNTPNQTFSVVSQWQGANGPNQASLYYQIPIDPITDSPNVGLSISASPAVVPYNGSTTITWTTTNAASCTAADGWSGSKSTAGSENFSNLKTTAIYSLRCKSNDGSSSINRSTKVYVSQLPAPTVELSAAPASVKTGDASTLSWTTTNAVSCEASGDWSGSKSLSGSQSTGGLNADKTYTLTCVNTDGVSSAMDQVTVRAVPPPTLSFSGSPTSINYNSSSTLNWSSTNASSCVASGAWNGNVNTLGSTNTGALTSTRTYYLRCDGIGGSSPTQSVTIFVAPPPPPPPPPGVVFCRDDNYNGPCWGPYPNDCSWVVDCGVPNDVISSIYFAGGYNRNTRIWWDIYFGGACRNIGGNTSSLGSWSDNISSWATGGFC
jgi:type II secretory pathway pseudopilin PulG